MNISPIIQASELLGLYPTESIILIDATNGKNAKENYQRKHLKGALFVDLNTQLADIKPDVSDGGRHPLPTVEQFAETLTELGISKNSHVVVYDDKNGSNAAARFWWMLKSVGHKKVQVLNGGLREAEKIGFPITNEKEEVHKKENYNVKKWVLPMSNILEIEKASENDDYIIIDVRDNQRYKGKTEPIDSIAGHIPGAINVPFSTNLDADELFLKSNELRHKYEKIFKNKSADKIIVHCGSGVTACHTLLAVAYAGLKIPKLYVGSWSEWSGNNKKVATEV